MRPDEVYVEIGTYHRVNCWGCLVFYGWASLDDVPEAIRLEVAAAQERGERIEPRRHEGHEDGRR